MQTRLRDLHLGSVFLACALLLLASCRKEEGHTESVIEPGISEDTQIRVFWGWFERNADRVAREATDPDVVEEVSHRVKELGDSLEVEMAVAKSPKELVISAGGLKRNRQLVEKIVALAPREIDGWKVVAFRQPKPEISTYSYESATLSLNDVKFVSSANGGLTDLVLYIRGLESGEESLVGCAFLMLDGQVGELNVMTKVGAIDFEPMSAAPSSARPIADLKALLL